MFKFAWGVRVLAVAGMASGCASMVASGPAHLSVTSNPAGASVYLNDLPAGATPMVVDLASDLPKAEIRLELPGFETVRLTRDKKLNGWVWGNILLGGVLGVAIDFATGAAHRFDDTPVAVDLTRGVGDQVEPPQLSEAECKEQRHRIFVDAMDIQDPRLRLKKLRTAPVCK